MDMMMRRMVMESKVVQTLKMKRRTPRRWSTLFPMMRKILREDVRPAMNNRSKKRKCMRVPNSSNSSKFN
jgi:hypothetical protein